MWGSKFLGTTKSVNIDTGVTKFDASDESDHVRSNKSTSVVDLPEYSSQTFLHFRFRMIFLWASSVLGFGIVMTVILRGRKRHKKKGNIGLRIMYYLFYCCNHKYIVDITKSTIDMKDESHGRPIQKAKIWED